MMVRSRVPRRCSAARRFSGLPLRPNPPTMMEAPSGPSAAASSAACSTFCTTELYFAVMRPLFRHLTIAAVLVVGTNALAQERRAPTLDDLLNLVQVSGAEISPDGRQVIYSRSEIKKWSDNKRVATIWIANADGSDHRQLLFSDKDRSPEIGRASCRKGGERRR